MLLKISLAQLQLPRQLMAVEEAASFLLSLFIIC